VLLLLWFVGAGTLWADQVALKNGDRLTGTIVKLDAKTLVLKTEFAGNVSLKWDAVSTITSTAPLHVALKDGRTVVGAMSTVGEKIQVTTKEAGEISSEKESVVAVRNDAEEAAYQRGLHPRFVDLWSGLLDTGLSRRRAIRKR